MNIRNFKVDGRSPLSLLTGWHNANKEPKSATIEKCHLRRSCKE